jgi:hypothetical protein
MEDHPMSTYQQISALPWTVEVTSSKLVYVCATEGGDVARVGSLDDPDAAVVTANMIVTAVNNHADMLAAFREVSGQLAAVAGLLWSYPRPSNDPNGRILLDAMEIAKASAQAARAILARIEGA